MLVHGGLFQSTLLMRGATRQYLHLSPERGRFQSMLLMRGATRWYRMEDRRQPDFNPRSSCEERPSRLTLRVLSANFNPRSSCEERQLQQEISAALTEFQSTLLMRGATVSILGIDLPDFIIYFSRTYPFSPKMPTSRHLSCKLHFLCDGTSHFGDL